MLKNPIIKIELIQFKVNNHNDVSLQKEYELLFDYSNESYFPSEKKSFSLDVNCSINSIDDFVNLLDTLHQIKIQLIHEKFNSKTTK